MTHSNRPLAVITGATGGIGRDICRLLAREGYDIVAQYHSQHDRAEQLKSSLEEHGVYCATASCDLGTPDAIDAVDAAVEEALTNTADELKVLVNNAAMLLGPSLSSATHEQFDAYMAVNVRAPFFLTQRLSLRMPAGGAIVNVSSAGVHFSCPDDIVYAMSKAALESMAFHAAESLAERGIRINAVIPGFTDNGHELFSIPEARAHMSTFAVQGDVADPSVVAEAVLFLASDRASRTTGTTLDVSGGSTLGARPRSAENLTLLALQSQDA